MKPNPKRTPTHRRTANRPASDNWLKQTKITPTQKRNLHHLLEQIV